MVNKKRIRLWVEALESGRFERAVGRTRQLLYGGNKYAYCPLGVAMKVYEENTQQTVDR